MPDMSSLFMLSDNFPLILNAIDDAVIITDNNDVIIFWNRSASRIFGYTREEVLEKKLQEFNLSPQNSRSNPDPDKKSPDESSLFTKYLNDDETETSVVKKDGVVIDVAYTVSRLNSRTGSWIGNVIIARDITRQKRMIADQEKMIKLMVGREQKMVELKKEISELKGELYYYLPIRKAADDGVVNGKPEPKSLDHPENDKNGVRGIFSRVGIKIGRYMKRLSPGHEEIDDHQVAILNILEDVEEEKNRSEIMAKDLEKFRLAVENSSDHIVITDPEGTILFTNSAVEKITGFPPREVIGRKAGSKGLWGGMMGQEFYEKLWSVIKIQKKTFLGEFGNHRKNGDKYIAFASIYPVLGKEGEVLFFVDIERDITREKEVDRMKTEFISLASHQLKTPLSALKWFSEILLNGDAGKLNDEQQEMVSNIYQSNERMIQLVNSLLNISRIESGRIIIDPVPTDLGELVKDVARELKNKIEAKKQKLNIDIESGLPHINIDPKLIREVYKNLLTNSIKYSPSEGEIKVFITRKDREIISEITDSGYGIPQSEHYKIFRKFFRGTNIVKIETDGTGLGLYLTKAIIDSSGGKIWFESQEGKGSTFSFSLNLAGVKKKEGEVFLTPETVQ